MNSSSIPSILPSRSEILRALARESREALSAPPSEARDPEPLLRRIDEVRQQMNVDESAPISRWLDNLRRDLVSAPTDGAFAS